MVRVIGRGEALDGYPGNALHGFEHTAVGQGAYVVGGDGIHHGVGVAFDILRVLQIGAHAGDNHFFQAAVVACLGQYRGSQRHDAQG